MATFSRSRLGLITVVVAGLVALTGCSADAHAHQVPHATSAAPTHSAARQSTTEACTTLKKAVTGAVSKLSSSLSTISTDPSAAIAGLDAVSDSLDGALANISNENVENAGMKANASLKIMISQLKTILADPEHADKTAFLATTADVQKDFSDIDQVCD